MPKKLEIRKECDRLSCDGNHTEFTLFFHKKIINTSIA